MSWCRAHSGTCDQILLLVERCCLKIEVLCLWGYLSDKRTGLQFAVQSLNGPSGAEPVTILYSLICDSPNLEDQVPVFISPRNKVAQIYPRLLGSLYVASYDSKGHGGGWRMVRSKAKVTLWPTVSQSVSMSWCLEWILMLPLGWRYACPPYIASARTTQKTSSVSVSSWVYLCWGLYYSLKLLISLRLPNRYANIILGEILICNVLCTGVDILQIEMKYLLVMCRGSNINRYAFHFCWFTYAFLKLQCNTVGHYNCIYWLNNWVIPQASGVIFIFCATLPFKWCLG
jgi:hypothetical protein